MGFFKDDSDSKTAVPAEKYPAESAGAKGKYDKTVKCESMEWERLKRRHLVWKEEVRENHYVRRTDHGCTREGLKVEAAVCMLQICSESEQLLFP